MDETLHLVEEELNADQNKTVLLRVLDNKVKFSDVTFPQQKIFSFLDLRNFRRSRLLTIRLACSGQFYNFDLEKN